MCVMWNIFLKIKLFLKVYWFESILVVGGVFLWLRGIGTHYIWNQIPLGYDPGLYKVLFEEMNALLFRSRSELSSRLTTMYPPFLGMLWSLLMKFGRTSQGLVTWWVVWLSWLMVLSLTAISRRFGTVRMSALVFFLACSSFVLYQLFWWNYMKQILGVVLVLSSLHVIMLWSKNTTFMSVMLWVLLCVWWLTQRPALILCGILWWVWFLAWINKRGVWIWSMVAVWILTSIWRYFWEIQIVPMIQPFFNAIDLPTYRDGYKAGGTFLTMGERLRTDVVVILGGLVWVVGVSLRKSWRKNYWIFLLVYVILILWVGWQAMFYQRMIWYLSPFLIIWTWYILSILSYKKHGIIIVGVLCVIQWVSTIYRIYTSRTPLIAPQEREMIQHIPQLVEDDAIIMLSWIRYSPWVRGRSWREVIAPWLFDYTMWWNQWAWRADQRINVSWDEKCDNAFETFGYLDRPLYVRVWLTQDKEIMNGWCMKKVLRHSELPTALYKLTDERK